MQKLELEMDEDYPTDDPTREKIRFHLDELKEEIHIRQWEFARKWVDLGEAREMTRRHRIIQRQIKIEMDDLRESITRLSGAIQALGDLND